MAIRYAISDIHGHLDLLDRALEQISFDPTSGDELFFLGDYIDRGPDSAGVLRRIRELHRRHAGAIVVLKGNHEQWFLDWVLAEQDDEFIDWLAADMDSDNSTLSSFLTQDQIADLEHQAQVESSNSMLEQLTAFNRLVKERLRHEHGELVRWVSTLALYAETDEQIFVHAGIDEEAEDLWHLATDDETFMFKYPATTGPFYKTIVAGHVATLELSGSHDPFFDGAAHWYIDGSAENDGQLNVLRFDSDSQRYSWFAIDASTAHR